MGAERGAGGRGAESGCHKNRLERRAANRPLTLHSHALKLSKGQNSAFVKLESLALESSKELSASYVAAAAASQASHINLMRNPLIMSLLAFTVFCHILFNSCLNTVPNAKKYHFEFE